MCNVCVLWTVIGVSSCLLALFCGIVFGVCLFGVFCFVAEHNGVPCSCDGIWFVVCTVGMFCNICNWIFGVGVLDVLMFGYWSHICFTFMMLMKCGSNCC